MSATARRLVSAGLPLTPMAMALGLPGLKDKWQCKLMVSPTGRGGARGPGDGAIAPYAGFAKDAARKDFGVMSKNIGEWGAQACTGPSALSCGL